MPEYALVVGRTAVPVVKPEEGKTPDVVVGRGGKRVESPLDKDEKMLLIGMDEGRPDPVGSGMPLVSSEAALETKLEMMLDTSGIGEGSPEPVGRALLSSEETTESRLETTEGSGRRGVIPADVGAVGLAVGLVTPDPLLGSTPVGRSVSDGCRMEDTSDARDETREGTIGRPSDSLLLSEVGMVASPEAVGVA